MRDEDLQAEGERLKVEGMGQAGTYRPKPVAWIQLHLLKAIIYSPTRTGSIDDATPSENVKNAYGDGGKWVGPSVASLADEGLIEKVRDPKGRMISVLSCRPSRHRSPVTLWQASDVQAIRKKIGQLQRKIDAFQAEPRQPTLFDNLNT